MGFPGVTVFEGAEAAVLTKHAALRHGGATERGSGRANQWGKVPSRPLSRRTHVTAAGTQAARRDCCNLDGGTQIIVPPLRYLSVDCSTCESIATLYLADPALPCYHFIHHIAKFGLFDRSRRCGIGDYDSNAGRVRCWAQLAERLH